MKRWYDKDQTLSGYLEQFKKMKKSKRDLLCEDIIEMIKEKNSDVFEKLVLDFPLELQQRRWYDKDPLLWLMFNGLSMADSNLLKRVKSYLKKNLELQNV